MFIILSSALFTACSLAEQACLVNEAHCMGGIDPVIYSSFGVQLILLCYPVISES